MSEKKKAVPASSKSQAAPPAADLSAPPEDFGPAIPLSFVQANHNIDCLGPCRNQLSVRLQPGGPGKPVTYRIDLLPKLGTVRIYSFSSFDSTKIETPEIFVALANVRQYKLLHPEAWYSDRLAWLVERTSDPRVAEPAVDEDDAVIEPESD